MPRFNLNPEWESLRAMGRPVGVDKENGIIYGYVVAQRGPFKHADRGEFDDASLASIVAIMSAKPNGTKSRFAHPSASNDGLGKFLGRAKDPRIDGDRVRADLHLDPSSRRTPSGDIGGYLMELAANDPAAMSSSLVLKTKKEYRLNADGSKARGLQGEELAPLWRPEAIHASDIVDTGEAVDGLLSAGIDVDDLPLAALWRGTEMLNSIFAGQPRDVVACRLSAFVERYLDGRYGPPPGPSVDLLRRRIELKAKNFV